MPFSPDLFPRLIKSRCKTLSSSFLAGGPEQADLFLHENKSTLVYLFLLNLISFVRPVRAKPEPWSKILKENFPFIFLLQSLRISGPHVFLRTKLLLISPDRIRTASYSLKTLHSSLAVSVSLARILLNNLQHVWRFHFISSW